MNRFVVDSPAERPSKSFSAFDIVTLVGSAGGMQAVRTVVSGLPADFPAAVLVVLHRTPREVDLLPGLIASSGRLPVVRATEGEPVRAGTVHVLPPPETTSTLVLGRDGRFERVPLGSPSARGADGQPSSRRRARQGDAVLMSVGRCVGERAIGVVLSGMLSDGACGSVALKFCGGRMLVQSPDDAPWRDMPASAIATGCVDFALPLRRIAPALVALTMTPGAAELFRVPLAPWAGFPE